MFLDEARHLVLESQPCTNCGSDGYVPSYTTCVNEGILNKQGCCYCGAKIKQHRIMHTSDVQCPTCKGLGSVLESTDQPLPLSVTSYILWHPSYDIPQSLRSQVLQQGTHLLSKLPASSLINPEGLLCTRVVVSMKATQRSYSITVEPYWS